MPIAQCIAQCICGTQSFCEQFFENVCYSPTNGKHSLSLSVSVFCIYLLSLLFNSIWCKHAKKCASYGEWRKRCTVRAYGFIVKISKGLQNRVQELQTCTKTTTSFFIAFVVFTFTVIFVSVHLCVHIRWNMKNIT